MTFRRWGAAGISHDQSFIIFGGSAGSLLLSSTEIITEQGGVSPGPEMPEAVRFHSIASVDATTSIIIGGQNGGNSYSPKTWFFYHASQPTQQFQPGPLLITGRSNHASATIQDHITMENIVAVVGGRSAIIPQYSPYPQLLDSTELLIDGEWQQGKNNVKL